MNGAVHDQLQAEIILARIVRANMIDRVTDLIENSQRFQQSRICLFSGRWEVLSCHFQENSFMR